MCGLSAELKPGGTDHREHHKAGRHELYVIHDAVIPSPYHAERAKIARGCVTEKENPRPDHAEQGCRGAAGSVQHGSNVLGWIDFCRGREQQIELLVRHLGQLTIRPKDDPLALARVSVFNRGIGEVDPSPQATRGNAAGIELQLPG